ncbi:MAG: CDC27 family protein [Treponema sp.]|nr:CDC27 family protein [Treponema sp.]
MRNFLFLICFVFLGAGISEAQSFDINRGERAAAQLYVSLAENAIDAGRWSEALIVLERGSDYADVSSDISYLLALVRSHLQQPRGTVLQALGQALDVNNFIYYPADDARLLAAQNLIAMKYYREALNVLSQADMDSPASAGLNCLALRFSDKEGFLRFTLSVMGVYPRDPEPARIFLDYLKTSDPEGLLSGQTERDILNLILQRLPVLLVDDPELAWMAAPYIRDTQEAGRLVAAYLAANTPAQASLIQALRLGLIDETTAVDDFFGSDNGKTGLDISLLEAFYDYLTGDAARDSFMNYLANFSGIITFDSNNDGIPESSAVYLNGLLSSFSYDEDQDYLPELAINFWAGDPQSAVIVLPAEQTGLPVFFGGPNNGNPSDGAGSADRKISLRWERYPAVQDAELNGERYIPRPFEFSYAPVLFRNFWDFRFGQTADQAGNGIVIPVMDSLTAALTRRVLIANSVRVERPSPEFPGATEVVELSQSIPVGAREYLNGRVISETDFLRGRPIAQRVDLDLDGRLETFRHFRRYSLVQDGIVPPPETLLDYNRDFDYAESDWAGDGVLQIQYF